MPLYEKQTVRFGPFEFDPHSGELFKNRRKLKLEGQPLQVLAILLEKPGTLVTREEICKHLWPADTFVDSERILNADIWKLRQALGDNAENPRYIETLPKRGYRFIWETAFPQAVPRPLAESPAPIRRPSRSRIAQVCFVGSLLILISAAYWYGTPRTPRIVGAKQLTHTGHQKSRNMPVWCFLATDGSRLYFQEHRPGNRWVLSQVAVTGGEISDIPTPFQAGYQCLHQLKADGSELLVSTFDRSSGDGWQFWAVPLPSGPPHKLPTPQGTNWALWSASGRDLFHTSRNDTELYHLDLETGSPRRLFTAPDISYPRLSPRGDLIRFTGLVTTPGSGEYYKEQSIWESNADGTNLHRLFPDPEQRTSFGDWTPDGKLFFFFKYQGTSSSLWALPESSNAFAFPGKPTLLYAGPLKLHSAVASKDGRQLFVIGADERAELNIFDKTSKQFIPFLSGIPACFVDFSPDRRWIAYVSYPDGNLWRSRIDGTGRQQLTFPPMGVILPRWSPDGKLIVFMDWYSGETHKIYSISPEGGAPHLLLSGEFQPSDPTWSPDGGTIAYGGAGPGSEVRLYDLESAASTTVPGSQGYFSPRWSPDGKFIVAIKPQPRGLMLYEFASKRWSVLVGNMPIEFPSWAHDSQHIYFSGQGEIVRMDIHTRRIESVASLENVRWTAFRFRMLGWFGLAPDDRIMMLRDTGTEDIYALDLEY
jgi:Tol biopolymer transport system component/DNA-binding winged helix-turn-helix (wHTH) protein